MVGADVVISVVDLRRTKKRLVTRARARLLSVSRRAREVAEAASVGDQGNVVDPAEDQVPEGLA